MGERRVEVLQSAYGTEVPDQRNKSLTQQHADPQSSRPHGIPDKAYEVMR
jgi:hypothetical protein